MKTELSMTDLNTFQRCRRKFYYAHEMGLDPKTTNENMQMGTLFHKGMQGGYNIYKHGSFMAGAIGGLDYAILHGYDYGGQHYTLNLPKEKCDLVHDMVAYYWENKGQYDRFDEILSVEEPLYYETESYRIKCTFDLLARCNGHLVLCDHKSTGDVAQGLEFFSLDFQLLTYDLAAHQTYDEPMEVWYNMVKRDVPPGYGHNTGLTPTGRVSKRSTNPSDYLRREVTLRSDRQREAFKVELDTLVQEVLHAKEAQAYTRTPLKSGGNACKGCPYFMPCSAELGGNKLDPTTLAMQYNFKEAVA